MNMPANVLLVRDAQRHTNWAERLALVEAKLQLAIAELGITGGASLSKRRLEKAQLELKELQEEMRQ